MTHDPKVYWLATQFIGDTDLDPRQHAKPLADRIQATIEEYLEEEDGK
jgi:hypothetical protein